MAAGPDTSNYRKYHTGNPIVRWMLNRFLAAIRNCVEEVSPASIVDIGCGEGLVVESLRGSLGTFRYLGIDVNADSIQEARRRNPGLSFLVADLFSAGASETVADLVLCLEVLEHLEEPERALHSIIAWGRSAVISVPWEPYFRAGTLLRGKYVRRLGNHPEHVQQFNVVRFRRLLETSLDSVDVRISFPWLIGTGRVP